MEPMKFGDIPMRVNYVKRSDVFHLALDNGETEIRYTLTPNALRILKEAIRSAEVERNEDES